MTTRSKTAIFAAVVLLPAVSLVTALLNLPAVTGAAWHSLFGDATDYLGWKVSVPPKFYAMQSNGMLVVVTASTDLRHLATPDAFMAIANLTMKGHLFTRQTDWENFSAQYSKVAEAVGYRVSGVPVVSAAGTEGYCVETTKTTSLTDYQVACWVEGTTLMAQYKGPEEYLSTFYAVLAGMSRTAAH